MDRETMKFKVGDTYNIVFDDHAMNANEPMVCDVWGKILECEERYVKIAAWTVRSEDPSTYKDNLECFILLKSCIREWSLLCQKRTWRVKK